MSATPGPDQVSIKSASQFQPDGLALDEEEKLSELTKGGLEEKQQPESTVHGESSSYFVGDKKEKIHGELKMSATRDPHQYSIELAFQFHPEGLVLDDEKELFELTKGGLDEMKDLEPTEFGQSCSYFMVNRGGKKVALFKPADEEVGCSNNTKNHHKDSGFDVGMGFKRELAAYLLDKQQGQNAAGVPTTIIVLCCHPDLVYKLASSPFPKLGSLQRYVSNEGDLAKFGDIEYQADNIKKISILDIRLGNIDRHSQNLLVTDSKMLVPIDHGCCLPLEWLYTFLCWHLQEIAKMPYSQVLLLSIGELDSVKDIETLRVHGIELPFKSVLGFEASTYVLKEGARRNLTPYKLGYFMATAYRQGKSTASRRRGKASSFCMMMLEIEERLKEGGISTVNDEAKGIVKELADSWLDKYLEKNDEDYVAFMEAKRVTHEEEINRQMELYNSDKKHDMSF